MRGPPAIVSRRRCYAPSSLLYNPSSFRFYGTRKGGGAFAPALTPAPPQRLTLRHRRFDCVLNAFPTTTATTIYQPRSWSCLSPASHHRRHHYQQQQQQQQQQVRLIFTSLLPDAITQGISVWGGTAFLLKTIHGGTTAAAVDMVGTTTIAIPYWACFAIISIMVRTALLPVVIYGAQTSVRLAKVVPEIQFLLTLFQNDLKRLRQRNAPLLHRLILMRTNLATLGGIYRLHRINPFSVFLSPLLQMPIFIYISIDLRKIVNGRDPLLAQQLVDSPVGWIPDLTEPDPWFGLPVFIGLLMYWNLEVALGRRSLSGPATSKMDTAVLLKDLFQSGAVFMPCFTSQLPSGIQIYVLTSFLWTVVQSSALRTESFRQMVGLPSLAAPPPTAKYAQEFIQLKQLEEQARQARGNEPLFGRGVLALDFETSFPGQYRPTTIQGSTGLTVPILPPNSSSINDVRMKVDTSAATDAVELDSGATMDRPRANNGRLQQQQQPGTTTPFIHGVSAPWWQLEEQRRVLEQLQKEDAGRQYMPQIPDEVMDKANRGEVPRETQFYHRPVVTHPTAAGGAGPVPAASSGTRAPLAPFKLRVRKPPKGKKGKSR